MSISSLSLCFPFSGKKEFWHRPSPLLEITAHFNQRFVSILSCFSTKKIRYWLGGRNSSFVWRNIATQYEWAWKFEKSTSLQRQQQNIIKKTKHQLEIIYQMYEQLVSITFFFGQFFFLDDIFIFIVFFSYVCMCPHMYEAGMLHIDLMRHLMETYFRKFISQVRRKRKKQAWIQEREECLFI